MKAIKNLEIDDLNSLILNILLITTKKQKKKFMATGRRQKFVEIIKRKSFWRISPKNIFRIF